MTSYYLWAGIGAIEDLDDCEWHDDCGTVEEAVKALKAKTAGDWTLWRRTGMEAKLVAIYSQGCLVQFVF